MAARRRPSEGIREITKSIVCSRGYQILNASLAKTSAAVSTSGSSSDLCANITRKLAIIIDNRPTNHYSHSGHAI